MIGGVGLINCLGPERGRGKKKRKKSTTPLRSMKYRDKSVQRPRLHVDAASFRRAKSPRGPIQLQSRPKGRGKKSAFRRPAFNLDGEGIGGQRKGRYPPTGGSDRHRLEGHSNTLGRRFRSVRQFGRTGPKKKRKRNYIVLSLTIKTRRGET